MTLKALFYAYVLGGLTFLPLVVAGIIFFTIYTSVPIGDVDLRRAVKGRLEVENVEAEKMSSEPDQHMSAVGETNDIPRTRRAWVTMRRTFEESSFDGGYVTLVRSFLDSRSKDPKRSRPKDMWYVVLKGKVLYLYEDEEMTECEAAVELGGHEVVIYPEGLLDGELFAKRNAIYLKPLVPPANKSEDIATTVEQTGGNSRKQEKNKLMDAEGRKEATKGEALNPSAPWFIFVRSNIEMEDWYLALIHASDHPTQTPTLSPLFPIFQPADMNHLVTTLDEQPDVIPMRWLNALIGRIFFSYYRTHTLEAYIISRLMKKLSKVKRPTFLNDVVVTEVSVGNKAPTFSKPMLKELTKEGDASMEIHLQYKGEVRITVEATTTINLGARFKSYTVKLVLAAVLKELEGNLLVKVKRPPTNRIWYAFTQTPRMVLEVEPVVSDRQITWGMILSTIESRLKEIIQESVVMPNMDDIAFFESSLYQHRGGIWQDASRRERQSSLIHESTSNGNQFMASASVQVAQATPAIAVEPPSQPTQPVKELVADIPSSSLSSDPPVANLVTEEPPSSPPLNNRQRTWFSSVRSEDLSKVSEEDFYIDASDDDTQRGRTIGLDRPNDHRSLSTPNQADSIRNESSERENEERDSQVNLAPQSTRRSSQHSLGWDRAKTTSSDSIPSTPDSSCTKSTPSKNWSPSPGTNNPLLSQNSFFSTLKSRAGDKQALGNTAKEAMRKWGVNWGNLRKESSGGNPTKDDGSDNGSIGSWLQSENNGLPHKARASYAEVRAAVAERRGRDKAHFNDESWPTSPIRIPEGAKGKARVVSNPSVLPDHSAVPESTGLLSSYRSSSTVLPVGESLSSSRKSSPSISRLSTEPEGQDLAVPDSSELRHVPILVQPQAKTMTIPGIHASHRGEVMSMGYVAPHPQPPIISEGKFKNSSIQNVYRLWKSPVLSGQEQQSQPHQDSPQPLRSTEVGSRDRDIVPLALARNVNSPPQSPSRPIPPPLPPRSTTIAIPGPSVFPLDTSSDASPSSAFKDIASQEQVSAETSVMSSSASSDGTESA